MLALETEGDDVPEEEPDDLACFARAFCRACSSLFQNIDLYAGMDE